MWCAGLGTEGAEPARFNPALFFLAYTHHLTSECSTGVQLLEKDKESHALARRGCAGMKMQSGIGGVRRIALGSCVEGLGAHNVPMRAFRWWGLQLLP